MTHNVFGGTLNLAQLANRPLISEKVQRRPVKSISVIES